MLVTVFDELLWLDSYSLTAELHAAGLDVVTYPEPAKLPKQFKFADKMSIRVTLVIGPDEAAAGKVTIKNLKSGTQETVLRADVEKVIRKTIS